MTKKRNSDSNNPASIERRTALKQLGAIAFYGPVLASIACDGDPEGIDRSMSPAGGGPGGGGVPDAGGPPAPGAMGPDASGSISSGGNLSGGGNPSDGGNPSGGRLDAGLPRDAGTQPQPDGSFAPVSEGGASGTVDAAAASSDAGATVGPGDFESAASCTLTTTDIEGPFLIEEDEVLNDATMVRRDVREGMHGCEFRLNFRLLNARNNCAPMSNVQVYIWHCNADGLYSGFKDQDPSMPYRGAASRTPENMDRFCRGVQSTNMDGIVSFTTVYPGWYAGRPIHVHLIARMNEMAGTTRYITTQLYFAAAFTREVHTSEPAYMARAASIPAGSLNPPSGRPAMPTMKHTPGLVVGTMNVIVNGPTS